jgi:nucleoside-diphosphate-sugar epimerase
MNILITGGAGYIGSVLTGRLLEAGHRVRVLDAGLFGGEALLHLYHHDNFEYVPGDVRDAGKITQSLADVESVVHLAAIVGEPACNKYPDLARSTNLDATRHLVDESKRSGIRRFVFSSTCSNYGVRDISQLADENAPLNPVSLYAETKVEAENYVAKAASPEFCSTVLRFATVFGLSPRMRFDLLLNELIRDAVARKWVVLYGPKAWRPFVHVVDASRAIQLTLETPEKLVSGQTFNVGSNDGNYQKQQLADLILKHVPYADVEIMERKADPRDYRVSFEKIRTVLGFTTTRTVEQGIVEMRDALLSGVIGDPSAHRYDNVTGQLPINPNIKF